jgi:hypothetical protein
MGGGVKTEQEVLMSMSATQGGEYGCEWESMITIILPEHEYFRM